MPVEHSAKANLIGIPLQGQIVLPATTPTVACRQPADLTPRIMGSEGLIWLVVEDGDNDFVLFRRACSGVKPKPKLCRLNNGLEAQHYLLGAGNFADRARFPLPSLIVSDIKMPCVTGLELLEWFRNQPLLQEIPFVLLTDSDAARDRYLAYNLRAAEYLVKPVDFQDLCRMLQGLVRRHC